MFGRLVSETENLALTGLLVFWALLLFGGFIFGRLNSEETHRMPTWTRMASSFVLVTAAWGWYLVGNYANTGVSVFLVAAGMTLGFIGDLFMARLLPIKEFVLGGIGSFGLGHVAYIIASVLAGNQLGLPVHWGALVGWWLVGTVGWYVVVYRGAKERTILHIAALPYALLLASTAGLATGLALQADVFVPLALGSALFLLSDLLLAAQLFNGLHFRFIGDIVWLLYGPGQMLIVYGFAWAIANLT